MATQLTYSISDFGSSDSLIPTNPVYFDWKYLDAVGADYSSYFITGYKVHGEGLRQFQGNYLVIFMDVQANSSAFVQYLWDYPVNNLGHRMSTPEQCYNTANFDETKVSKITRRVWMRGQGRVMEIKFYSGSGKPFNIIGYSIFETGKGNV